MSPSKLIREARRNVGLTQAELAERAGTTQPMIARLERGDANPTVETLERVLHAAGHRLELTAVEQGLVTVDESLIREHLELSPAERIRDHDARIPMARMLLDAGARARERHA